MAAFHISLFTYYEVILSFFEKVKAKSKIKAIQNLVLWLFFPFARKILATSRENILPNRLQVVVI